MPCVAIGVRILVFDWNQIEIAGIFLRDCLKDECDSTVEPPDLDFEPRNAVMDVERPSRSSA